MKEVVDLLARVQMNNKEGDLIEAQDKTDTHLGSDVNEEKHPIVKE